MASIQFHHCLPSLSSKFSQNVDKPLFLRQFQASFSGKVRVYTLRESVKGKSGVYSICCFCKANNVEIEKPPPDEEIERPPFDINLAVILAGFAFEAYRSPPGTSDPYVVMQLDGQIVKSKVKWGKVEPTWNEDFTFNLKLPPTSTLQVAAWDANLVTPHKRMGNAGISLECLCDGDLHELLVELEGMGGGGMLQLEVRFKSFDQMGEERRWWSIPFVTEFLQKKRFESALKMLVGSEAVPARQFVQNAFGQLKSFNDTYLWKDRFLNSNKPGEEDVGKPSNVVVVSDKPSQIKNGSESSSIDPNGNKESNLKEFHTNNDGLDRKHASAPVTQGAAIHSDKQFWKNFTDFINQYVVQRFGVHVPEKLKWDGLDLLNRIGLESRKIAEARYIESGLATPKGQDVKDDNSNGSLAISNIHSSLPELKKAPQDLLRQMDSVLGALMVLTMAVSQLNKEAQKKESKEESKHPNLLGGTVLDEKKTEEMKALFSTAESAMEAWALLASSVGHPSFMKSEFEKICFLDNVSTDTQVAIWRDIARRRLVVAFRGTEQAKWKDLVTDLMLAPTGFNPERVGGDFKQEVQVHSGFLSAYDSVRTRIIDLIEVAIGYKEFAESPYKWQVYVTGHSLGGALATLLALELSSSQLAKFGAISLTMYNFGSPRVGNKRFAEVYNEKVKDSWRVVNHRDIIPTVPRLMGYCHVAQPVYLVAGDLKDTLENMELMKDGYHGDVIGEYTPDVLVSEFMKGEKELIEKILQTEINIFLSIRDGSALMQHMEDFYYVTLLENVRSNFPTVGRSQNNEQGSI
ncbi:C2 domain-containing protein/Lipase_3 domain-containing protein [Cephalotus follicularis]|uniref:C2 domain-containing protein/Lipase_3 domain-containing protein n=1 Tax=Cephalotus follicularis TaxID=3775 RepID=A0A1Q3BRC0_CEPFO|nr:C2 domain-containing protein/Lipase_3 domain-containing protein [Cephalotus follicularis]